MCEEQAQGNGATTVRVMRQRTRARREGGIPPTKYRTADGGCSAREESRFSPKGETNACVVSPAPEDALRGHGRGLAERNPFRRGGLHRTRPRSRICIRRAGRRTGKAPASKGEHGCPKQSRTLEGKPAQSINKVAKNQTFSQRLPFLLERRAASTKRIVRTPSRAPGKSCGLRSRTAAQNSR